MLTVLTSYWIEVPVAGFLLTVALAGFVGVGALLSVIDARTHRLPNRIVLPSYPWVAVLLGAAAALAGQWHRILGMLVGCAVLWVGFELLHLLDRRGLGFGDVKLAGLLGLYLGFAGWQELWWGPCFAILLGGLWSLGLVLTGRAGLGSAVAFGPFLILGAALALAVLR
ncbi:hypothetical protein AC792_04435 [Arthrobacter sp. RIT-PI-e]|uniref:prepilin peptidase n=1 Tax=Arthrobacter sp. RIT-PI-e TaxID=1681197 RepID=UPI000675F6D0|nr:A24 family peptidase [Arthrobacter sp. RIT-PI-e]KNC19647.1 hypothetical protein AC792_04435 [Arthrobacter sp. RIT-PI-e]